MGKTLIDGKRVLDRDSYMITKDSIPEPDDFDLGDQIVVTDSFAPDVTEVLLRVDMVAGVKSWTGTVTSASAPSDDDGLPNGVLWEQPPLMWRKVGGAYSMTPTSPQAAEFRRAFSLIDDAKRKVYQNRAERDWVIGIGGAEQSKFRNRIGYQDLMRGFPVLTDPLTNHTNVEIVNVGQQLVAIPGAESAPYWTDPGPVTLTRGNDATCGIPGTIPGAIEFTTKTDGTRVCRFTSAAGFGNAANGKRRSQVFFDWVSGRKKVAWELSFMISEDDDAPYSADPLYKYPFLLFQHKGAGEPMFGMNVEGNADGTYNLYWVHKYSSQSPDTVTFRRSWNSSSPASIQAQSGTQRFFERTIRKGEWVDMYIECFLDERDITEAAGGRGYLDIWINGEQVLTYNGPTLTIRDVGGATPAPHAWMVGIYRHETGAPTELKELDLNRQEDPAPFTRVVDFRTCRLLDLEG